MKRRAFLQAMGGLPFIGLLKAKPKLQGRPCHIITMDEAEPAIMFKDHKFTTSFTATIAFLTMHTSKGAWAYPLSEG